MFLNIKRCNKCLMVESKPGLTIHEDGLCDACHHDADKQHINYAARTNQLLELCAQYRRNDGRYDCIIPVSGGKDSTYTVYKMKELLNMNPLLVNVQDNYSHTRTGLHNLTNLPDITDCDIISMSLPPDVEKQMARAAFEEFGSPTWPIDRAIYTFPLRVAIEKDIPFIIYGENTSWEYGGVNQIDTPSALEQINNDAVKPVPDTFWNDHGVDTRHLNQMIYPTQDEIQESNLNPTYLSYFVPWDGYHNYFTAKQLGFKPLGDAWDRGGYIDDYDQIDSVGYLMNVWLKYPKYGYHRTTDMVGYHIRSELMDQNKGIKLIEDLDHILDPFVLADFLNYTGYTLDKFWKIVSKFWNKNIFSEAQISEIIQLNSPDILPDLSDLYEIAPPFLQKTNICIHSIKQHTGGVA